MCVYYYINVIMIFKIQLLRSYNPTDKAEETVYRKSVISRSDNILRNLRTIVGTSVQFPNPFN